MSRLLDEAKALETEARANLAKVPTMARVMYPDYIKSAEDFCDRLSRLVTEVEKVESLRPFYPTEKSVSALIS